MKELFRFVHPEFLWFLCLIPFLFLLLGNKGKKAAIQFSDVSLVKEASKHVKRKSGKWILYLLRSLTLALFIVAIARPQSGEESREVEASGIDIVLAVDTSSSMWAHDFKKRGSPIDRLTAVKSVMEEFIDKRPNDRIGLIAFAGAPYMLSPLTLKHDWLLSNIKRLEIGLIEDGTAIGMALATCVNRLRDVQSKSKVVILLTDGANNAGHITPVAAAEAAEAMGVKVYTIGAGKKGKVPFPRLDSQTLKPLLDRSGNMRFGYGMSDLDEESLIKIADITKGRFFRATDLDRLSDIYDEIDRLEKTEVILNFSAKYTEMFQWPLLLAILLLFTEQILIHTKQQRIP